MSVTVYTNQRQNLLLTTEIGRGGEGLVYSIGADECAKIYSKPLSAENQRKLELMVKNPPSDPAYATRKHRSISWPTALLYSDPGRSRCVGFSMPKIDVKVFRKAIYYVNPDDRVKQLGGGFNWKYLYTAAFNIVSSVAAIHERNYCIGDLNESNILIAPSALITLIDCDSFQVPNPAGKMYRCLVGKAEYTSPELQGKSYCDVDRTPQTDCFALAVLLFQLLMEGTHPYQAKGRLVQDAPSTQAKIVKGYFPYTMRHQDIAPPNHAPPFEILHPDIRQLFQRCFVDGHLKPQLRPTAHDWFKTLGQLSKQFKQCKANENHVFLDHLTACPWCGIVKTKGKDLFPSPVGGQIALDEPSVTLDSLQKRVDYLNNYVAMAFADGVLTPEEEAYLIALGSKLQIPRSEIVRPIQAEARRTKGRIASSASSAPWIVQPPPPQIIPPRGRPSQRPPPPPMVGRVLSSPSAPLTRSKSISIGRGVLLAAGILSVLLFGLYIVYTTAFWYSNSAIENKLDAAIARGELLKPEGASAYDWYHQLKKNGAGAEVLARFEKRLIPQLTAQPLKMISDFAVPTNPEPPLSDWQNALKPIQWACEMRPNDKVLNAREKYIEGRIAFISNQKDQALASWKKASDLDRTWAMPLNGVGVIYNEKKNFEAARKYLFEAVRREASWPVPYNSIGTSYFFEKKYDDASTYYMKAVERSPNWARPHAWLGDVAMRRNDFGTAIDEYQKVLDLAQLGNTSLDLNDIRKRLDHAKKSQQAAENQIID